MPSGPSDRSDRSRKPTAYRYGWARFDTALGGFSISWRDDSMVGLIALPRKRRSGLKPEPAIPPGIRLDQYPAVERLVSDIRSALEGRPVRFDLGRLRFEICPPFQRAVLRAVIGIPRGRVSSYRRVAARLGRPDSARTVGNALAHNPFPVAVPCHRVVRSDRTLGGFGGGAKLKRALLELEGVGFDPEGRVRGEFIHERRQPGPERYQ